MADNSEQPNSRWYTGGGIYRSVWLWVGAPESIAPEGLKVSTVSVDEPEVAVDVELLERRRMISPWSWNFLSGTDGSAGRGIPCPDRGSRGKALER